MKNESPQEREEQALHALAAAALRRGEEQEISQEEIDEYIKNPLSVSPNGKHSLEALGPNVIAKLTGASNDTAEVLPNFREPQRQRVADFAAMHRKNQTGENDRETEDELERKRQEILGKLKQKKGSEE